MQLYDGFANCRLIEPDSNIDERLLENAITQRTVAISPVHYAGVPCQMDVIMRVARQHRLAVIEDAAQSMGAAWRGRRIGSFGDLIAISFHANKNMTTAEGGMVTTEDGALAERIRVLRQHGARDRYQHDVLGYNFRMTEISAAIGRAQLAKLDRFNEVRRRNADVLNEGLARWSYEGRNGYGIAEYLHQLDEHGAPVVPID